VPDIRARAACPGGLCNYASLGFFGCRFHVALHHFRNMAFAEICGYHEGAEVCSAQFADDKGRWWTDASVCRQMCALRYCGAEDADSRKLS
jgi:hypothetical protein